LTLPVIFRARAEVELLEARAWYDEQQPGRGALFAKAVEDAIDQIAETPLAYPRVDDETRRAIVRTYRYLVYYRVRSHDIVILTIVHGHRNPSRWQSRG